MTRAECLAVLLYALREHGVPEDDQADVAEEIFAELDAFIGADRVDEPPLH